MSKRIYLHKITDMPYKKHRKAICKVAYMLDITSHNL